MSTFFSWQRLRTIIRKESIQMRRDRITFAMMLGVPLMQLMLFGFAINNDPKDLPAALVVPVQDRYSRAMVTALELTGYYRFTHPAATAAEAEALIAAGDVSFVVTMPSDFGRRFERGEHPQILIEADATDPAVASGAINTIGTVANEALLREARTEAAMAENQATKVDVVIHRRYNPEGLTQYNIVPGLLGVILQMTMVMMTAMALTRETERGTMENLLSMPVTPIEIMLGKVLPFFVVGAVQVVVVLVAARLIFGVPFAGSIWLLLLGVFVFVMALVVLGYVFSTLARTQMQAMQLTFFYFLPSILLSGFMFPFSGMPTWARWIGETLPLTHFLRLIRGVMLKGADLAAIASPLLALTGFAIGFTLLALSRFRQTLD
ncbi:ABC transporter permease [Sedimentimonas flavescens]|uniref:ABC transporter permease n=1 Tax=Sedimentimonas flavescens TaxID=2851012 RepID=A0ABT2ZZL1_9RHOB|nr:ABC transporter permease [Sedimentimonas flavescens]MBW0158151.1 ABC transporter permease [Sedimentimonas flavescens]MCT2539722.1 ABC transporter permease [Sedimentimonas flavescens]MCV2878919.1 ABC transporter permease [Sedimentimonas flavescens]